MNFGTGYMVQNNKRPHSRKDESLDSFDAQAETERRLEKIRGLFKRVKPERRERMLTGACDRFEKHVKEAHVGNDERRNHYLNMIDELREQI